MDLGLLALAIAVTVVCSLVITVACDSFENASGYLGRNMPAGVRGATIDAVASSLPELFTASFLLFVFHDRDGFSAGIATCAGSAVFNAVVIPALCVFAVMFVGVKGKDGVRVRLPSIQLDRKGVLRDGVFFVTAEAILIVFLGNTILFWWMGGVLMSVYVLYFAFLMYQFKKFGTEDDGHDAENGKAENEKAENEKAENEKAENEKAENEHTEGGSLLQAVLKLDFNRLFFGGQDFNNFRAWVVLAFAISVIGVACYFLSHAVIDAADALDVPTYFTAVILAAAATSVPDTVISVNAALQGDFDDAVSNAVGSNVFDICVALGFPLLVYGLVVGPVTLAGVDGGSNVQELRVLLVLVTGMVLGIFLFGKTIGWVKATTLFGIYVVWTLYIIGRAAEVEWLNLLI